MLGPKFVQNSIRLMATIGAGWWLGTLDGQLVPPSPTERGYMVVHLHESGGKQALGRFSVIEDQVVYEEPGDASHGFALPCREFDSRSKFDARLPRDLRVAGRDFVDRLHGQRLTPPLLIAGDIHEGIGKLCKAAIQRAVAEHADKEKGNLVANPLRLAILRAWHAKEAVPFAAIRAQSDSLGLGDGRWETKLVLPGAKECDLIRETNKEAEFAWMYTCKFSGDDETYGKLMLAVESALGVSPGQGARPSGPNQVLYSGSDPANGAWRLAVTRVTNPSAILLWIGTLDQIDTVSTSRVAPPHALPPPTAPKTEAELIREAIQIVKDGDHSDLPIVLDQNGRMRAGPASLKVRNDTPYTLTVLMSGPADRRLEIAARSGASIDLPSGTYKVAGKVDAPNVLPSYGEHALYGAANIQFYIQ